MNPNKLSRIFPNASAAFIKANVDAGDTGVHTAKRELPDMKIYPSTDLIKLNKTEKRYYEILRHAGHQWVGVQAVTLKLADDCRYTCDFMFLDRDGNMHGHEVKGFFRDDAKVKIKVAARMYPFIKFSVVKQGKIGFDITEVNP